MTILSNKKENVDFYTICLKEFHDEAAKNNLATKGLIFIPELIKYGEKIVLEFLKDEFFKFEFGNNPNLYYYIIMSLCIQSGIVLGEKWHLDFKNLDDNYLKNIISEGPADKAGEILEKLNLPTSDVQNKFYQSIYKKWVLCNEPYWALEDSRQYIFKSMLAAYQLGISIILKEYGL